MKRRLLKGWQCLRSRFNSRKVFCIGRNKTGTTSVAKALRQLGYNVAPQPPAERLLSAWSRREFADLIRFCRWFDAFQDIPFSLPDTYAVLDREFPGSKFILTVRRDADQWFESLVKFHGKKTGAEQIATWADLEQSTITYPGFLADAQRLVYGIRPEQLYDRAIYTAHYEQHNAAIKDYFQSRPEQLLTINIADPGAYRKFCDFLQQPAQGEEFPWENKT